jgi:putative tryptophan/tyrosine transport system substrate-binding protein
MKRRHLLGAIASAVAGCFVPVRAAQPDSGTLRVGWLGLSAASGNEDLVGGFLEGLDAAGFAPGRNLRLERRHASGDVGLLPIYARELIALGADVLVTSGTQAALAAKAATQTVPIVLISVGAPVESGLVDSLAAPGGNITGPSAAYSDFAPKWLELVREIAPAASVIGFLANTGNLSNRLAIANLESAAMTLGIELRVFGAVTTAELEGRLAAIGASRPDVLIVSPDAVLRVRQAQIVAVAERAKIPAVYAARDYVDAGGLMSYGPDRVALGRQAAGYVAKIARGIAPGQLPMEEPTSFELVLNQRAALKIGARFTAALLARASEVIE